MPDAEKQPHLIEVKVEPEKASDRDALNKILAVMAAEDKTFSFFVDSESGETVVAGGSEPHLDQKIEELRGRFGLGLACGAPQVAYLEALAEPCVGDHQHAYKTSSGTRLVRISFELVPAEPSTGNSFSAEVDTSLLGDGFDDAVYRGVASVWSSGALLGFPMVDTQVRWTGCEFTGAPSRQVFEFAARASMKAACDRTKFKLLEPIMNVAITTPETDIGAVLGDINVRRGAVLETSANEPMVGVTAKIPLANMFGYINSLHNMTNGLGHYAMSYSHYAELPRRVDTDGPDNVPPATGMRQA